MKFLLRSIAPLTLATLAAAADADRLHVSAGDVRWATGSDYPPALQAVMRWKDLVGGAGGGGADDAAVPQPDVYMGVFELAPGAMYPGHKHPSPELYYVMSGTARWSVGDETFAARAGTAIYHPPEAIHRMTNDGDEVLRAVYFWWAPGGDRAALKGPVALVEPVPPQPPQATFAGR
jgi:quercetin dioxygenase-like cupin family protein